MMLELKELFSKDNHAMEEDGTLSVDVFETKFGSFPIIEKTPLHLEVFHKSKRAFSVKGTAELVIQIPCDRCIEDVATPFQVTFEKNFDLEKVALRQDGEEETEEVCYITEELELDYEKLLFDELLVNWPAKVLCKEDCLGICKVCGHNLNVGDCGCDRVVLDPRMAAIQDIFKNANK